MSTDAAAPAPPSGPDQRPTVAEAKARLRACGERASAELHESIGRVIADAGAELRRSAVWLPLAALGLGAVFGNRPRRARRHARFVDDPEAASVNDPPRSRHWAWKVAPVVIDLIARARNSRR